MKRIKSFVQNPLLIIAILAIGIIACKSNNSNEEPESGEATSDIVGKWKVTDVDLDNADFLNDNNSDYLVTITDDGGFRLCYSYYDQYIDEPGEECFTGEWEKHGGTVDFILTDEDGRAEFTLEKMKGTTIEGVISLYNGDKLEAEGGIQLVKQ